MNRSARILLLVAIAAGCLFAVLIAISFLWLSPGGLKIFDARFFGYDAEAARVYLKALPEQGKTLYLGVFRMLDTVFPLLFAGAIGGAVWLNTPTFNVLRRIAVLGVVAAYLLMDLAENAFVAQMLRFEGQVPKGLIDRASDMTELKWMFLALALVQLLILWRRNVRGKDD